MEMGLEHSFERRVQFTYVELRKEDSSGWEMKTGKLRGGGTSFVRGRR